MPIRFEPAKPFNPAAASAYGAAQEFNALAPYLSAQKSALLGYASHEGDLTNQAVQAQAGRQQQAMLAGAELDQRRQEMFYRDHVSEAQAFQAAQQQSLLQQQLAARQNDMQLQSWLGQQELGQAEQMRLERLRNAVGDVMADQGLSGEEKAAIVSRLKTGIDPLQMRREASQARHLEQQSRLQMEEEARRSAREVEHLKMKATSAQSRVTTVTFPDGTEANVFTTSDGKDVLVPKKSGTELSQQQKGQMTEAQYLAEYRAIERQADAMVKAGVIDKSEWAQEVGTRLTNRGLPMDVNQFRGQQRQANRPLGGSPFDAVLDAAGGAFDRPLEPGPPPAEPGVGRQPAAEGFGPYDPGRPGPAQQQAEARLNDQLHALSAEVKTGRMTGEEYSAAADHVVAMRQLMMEFGSADRMPPAAKKKFMYALHHYDNAITAVRARPMPPGSRSDWQKFKAGDLVTTADLGAVGRAVNDFKAAIESARPPFLK